MGADVYDVFVVKGKEIYSVGRGKGFFLYIPFGFA